MWILSCSGDLLNGKRSWLRPGSIHLLGRTSGHGDGEQIRFIDHKSVSRKHLIIRVGETTDRDITSITARTKIELVDGSKIGTIINGEKIKQDTKVLTENTCNIRLGSYEQEFRLEWYPVLITNSTLSKASRKKEELKKLNGTDVKTIQEYISTETTHLVAKKRNTPTVLQALLHGKWVITDSWIDALAQALKLGERDIDGNSTRSLLEEDFDANWPKEADFLVPASTEPIPREDHYLMPNLERAEVFQDFTFVFLSQAQHDSLLAVVTGGGGKAMLRDVKIGISKVHDLVTHVYSIAGKGGQSDFKLSQYQGRGGVVVVRLNDKEDQRIKDFLRDVDLSLEQRSIEQSEFLDAVLTNDASELRRPLLEEDDSNPAQQSVHEPVSENVRTISQEVTTQRAVPMPIQSDSIPPESQGAPASLASQPTSKRRTRQIVTQSRFKGFDDVDPDEYKRAASPPPDTPELPASIQEEMEMEVSSTSSAPTRLQKRTRQTTQDQEMSYDSLLQGQAALKRRRLESKPRNTTSSDQTPDATDVAQHATRSKHSKSTKVIDVVAQLQAHQAKEAEERRKEDAEMRQQIAEIDVQQLKNLAIVEEMPIPDRLNQSMRNPQQDRNERWDPRWDGRKNFKKFRRQGQNLDPSRHRRVIVALEEAPRRGHGLGDEYWLTPSAFSAMSNSEANSQSQAHSANASSGPREEAMPDEDSLAFQSRVRHSRRLDAESAEDQRLYPEEIAGQARDEAIESTMRSSAATATTLAGDTQRGKRPATQPGGAPAKRARQTRITSQATPISVEDDDDDELKFKRRRR